MVLDEAEREVFAIAEKRSSSTEGPQNVISVLESTIARIDTLSKFENHSGVTGVTTGFVDLDKKTAGLQPSDLIIVAAARPSMGKTTFAMNLCENAAMAGDKPVLVFQFRDACGTNHDAYDCLSSSRGPNQNSYWSKFG